MKKIKKGFPFIFAIIASCLLLLFFIHLGFKDENVTRSSNDGTVKMQYALVNEDKGATFEGKNYSLGSDFVTLINKDTANRWETTTRDIANAGVDNGQFDARIIIPQDFSEKLLSLQAVNPEQASVEYQVRSGQNEITNQAIQDKVNGILKDFNQRVIQMYFSSIVGNLVEAQQNVNQITDTQIKYQSRLENSIYHPFKEIPTNYTTVLSTASILDEDHRQFTTEQESFVKFVQALLKEHNQSLEASSESTASVKKSVGDYTKEANQKIKKSIEQFNQQFDLQKKQLANQWKDDTTDYKKQFDQLNTTTLNQLGNFYTPSVQGDSGIYVNFLTEAKLFQKTQTTRIQELQTEITELCTQVEQLTALKKQIASTYYNDAEATPETATDEKIKQAIIRLMTNAQENTPNLAKNYREVLEKSLAQIPSDSLEKLVTELVNQHILTKEIAAVFYDELAIVQKYASDFGKELGSEVHFAYLDPKPTHTETINIPQEKVTFSLNTNTDTIISLQSKEAKDGNVTFVLDDSKIQQIKTELNQQLTASGYATDIAKITENSFTIAKPTKMKDTTEITETPVKTEGSSEEKTLELKTEESTLPKSISLTTDIPITWHLTSEQQQTAYNSIDYVWWVNQDKQSEASFATYVAMDQPLVGDLSELMKQFQILDSTAQQIVTLFGEPEQNLSVQRYAEMLRTPANQGKTIEDLTGEKSIYWMYNNLTDSEKEKMIADKLFDKYKKIGNQLYRETNQQINQLQKTIGTQTDLSTEEKVPTLYGTLNLMTVPEKLLQEADKLNAWFIEANQQVNAAYDTWKEAKQVEASSIINDDNPHPEANNTALLNSETDNLLKTMQTLMRTSKETSATTANSAAKVKDIKPILKELKATTTTVQEHAQNILTNLNESIDESKKTTKENEDYAKTFEQVLANTRNGGADNPQVFNFLSSPIQGDGVFGKTRQVSFIPYYATLIGAILTMTIAVILQGLMKKRVITEEEVLVEPTRLWQNIPNIIRILVSTILIACLFSGMLVMNITPINRLAGFSYSFLVSAGSVLLVLGCMRQFKKTTLYLCGALLGLFFMLTPLLGIATKPGSLSNWLYRLSPLQNIQNGFTALVNGRSISWISYFILIILVILGIILNLFVRPEE